MKTTNITTEELLTYFGNSIVDFGSKKRNEYAASLQREWEALPDDDNVVNAFLEKEVRNINSIA